MFATFAVIFALFGILFGLWSWTDNKAKRGQAIFMGILALIWGSFATIFVFGVLNENIPEHAPFLICGALPWLVGFGLRWLIDGRKKA